MILDPDACMYDTYILDPDTCGHAPHMYDAFIHDLWSWYMHVWCIYLCSSILDSDACMSDAHIYDPRSLTLMHVCMMHLSMILDPDPEACMYVWCMCAWCGKFCHERTNERTNKAILGEGCSWSWYMWPWCTYVWCIYPWSLILIHACMMHTMILHPWLWCMCVWCTYLWSWILILKHACMYDVCVHDAANFVTNGPTNERTRRF